MINHEFDRTALYLRDDGVVKCGAHVGTEATYTPSRWDLIGAGPSLEIEGMSLECEDTRCTAVSR